MTVNESSVLIEVLAHKFQAFDQAELSSSGSCLDTPVVMSFEANVICTIVDVEVDGVTREALQFYTKSGVFLAERVAGSQHVGE